MREHAPVFESKLEVQPKFFKLKCQFQNGIDWWRWSPWKTNKLGTEKDI